MKRILLIVALLVLTVPLLASALGPQIEELSVDSRQPAPVYSTNALEADKMYLLEASGTYTFGSGGRIADAEWYREPTWKEGRWDKTRSDWDPYGVLDLLVDPDQGGAINPDWGDFNPDHVYTMCYQGQGRPVSFVISDWWHTGNTMMGDNYGSLDVKIFELGCVEAWLPPIVNADFELQDGTTLPIKFRLCEPGDFSADILVTIVTPESGSIQLTPTYDADENHYIVVFHTRNYDLTEGNYEVIVTRGGCELVSYPFYLAPKASRGNSGRK